MAGGGGIQHPRGRQLGRRLEQPRDDQGQRQITAARRIVIGWPFLSRSFPTGLPCVNIRIDPRRDFSAVADHKVRRRSYCPAAGSERHYPAWHQRRWTGFVFGTDRKRSQARYDGHGKGIAGRIIISQKIINTAPNAGKPNPNQV